MREQALAELDVDPVGGVGKRIGAQILKRDVEQADDDEPADQHEQGLVAAMGQHLVDDDLEEERRREAENLHKQRRGQNMAERAAIAPDRRQEPAHPELARVGAGAADPARDQKRLSADPARDVLERRFLHRVADRIDEPAKPRRIPPAEHHQRAVHAHDRRRGQGRKPLRGHFGDQTGLEADEPGGANEVGFPGLAGAEREFAPELHRVGADAVIGRDPAQSAQAPVERKPFAHGPRGLHHRRFQPFRARRRAARQGSRAAADARQRRKPEG